MLTPSTPSKTKASAQRLLWTAAINAGWTPPTDTNPRTLDRWRTGQRFIPYALLCDMVTAVRGGGCKCHDAAYYARPRLVEESTHG